VFLTERALLPKELALLSAAAKRTLEDV